MRTTVANLPDCLRGAPVWVAHSNDQSVCMPGAVLSSLDAVDPRHWLPIKVPKFRAPSETLPTRQFPRHREDPLWIEGKGHEPFPEYAAEECPPRVRNALTVGLLPTFPAIGCELNRPCRGPASLETILDSHLRHLSRQGTGCAPHRAKRSNRDSGGDPNHWNIEVLGPR